MATKIINSKTNNYEREHDQEVVVEEYSPRSFLYSLRAGEGSQINNIRQTVIINLDENGQSDVKNINLGNYGDNEILYIQVNSSSIEHDSEQYANYNPVLFIHKDGVTEHIEASERGEGWSAFLVKQYNFTSAGNYELMFGLIETEFDTGNLADEYEIFLSNTIVGTVADTRIHGAYYEELDNASVIDEDYHNFIHKQPIVLSLVDNKLVITSAPVNINKGDRYSAYIELLGASEELEEYFLVGSVNDQYCFYKFTKDEDGTYKTWIPEEWTATDERYNVWIVGRSDSKRYVSELFNFQANKTFLDQGYFDDEVMGTSTGEQVVSITDQKLTLINTSAFGGLYKIQYTGEEIQNLLDYVKNNVIDKLYSKAEIDSKFTVVDGNISHISTNISGINNQIEVITTKTNTLESGLSTVNGAIAQINTNINGVNNQIDTLTTKTNELENELTTVKQPVQCNHRYEITGNTGDEHGLAISDQQMLLDRVQGRTLVKNQINNSGKTFTIASVTATAYGALKYEAQKIYRGHKYYVAFDVESDLNGTIMFKLDNPGYSNFNINVKDKGHYSKIDTLGNDGALINRWGFYNYYSTEYTFEDITIKNLQIIDLTAKYGAGKEPTTVEQVLNDMQGYEEYDEGSFVHSKNDLISTGRNLWNETWENGIYDLNTGNKSSLTGYIRSKDFIKVIPSLNYYLQYNGTDKLILCYDVNKNYIGYVEGNPFTTPKDCYYVNFYCNNSTYNNNICLNFSDSSFNSKYEPYQEDVMVVDRQLEEFDYIDNIANEKVSASSSTITFNGSEDWVFGRDYLKNEKRTLIRFDLDYDVSNLIDLTKYRGQIVCNKMQWTNAVEFKELNEDYYLTTNTSGSKIYVLMPDYAGVYTADEFKTWLASNNISFFYKLKTPTREPLQLPRGMIVWGNGMQIQKGTIPYLLTKTYSLSIGAQVKANIQIDKEQQDQINTLKERHNELREEFNNTFAEQSVSRETSALVDYPSKELSYPNQQVTVDEIRGRSLVVNQLAQPTSWGAYNGSLTNINNSNKETTVTIVSDSSTQTYTYGVFQSVNYTLNHKYLFKVDITEQSITNLAIEFGGVYYDTLNKGTNVITVTISKALNSNYLLIYPRTLPTIDSKFTMKNIELIDLTQMYGAGNEPTDVNQVLIDIDKFKVDGVLPYNLGELKDVEFSGVKSTGKNLLNEDKVFTESGFVNKGNGIYYIALSQNAYRKVLWKNNVNYKGQIALIYDYLFGSSKGVLFETVYKDGTIEYAFNPNSVLNKWGSYKYTSNASKEVDYIRFTYEAWGVETSFRNVMLTLGSNATYIPYEEDTYEIPQVDLKSAGTAYDSLYPSKGKFVNRVGVVENMSTLDWQYQETYPRFMAEVENIKNVGSYEFADFLCEKYIVSTSHENKTAFHYSTRVYIYDSAYTDVASFKASLVGQKLYYELAEPIETSIVCPNNYKAWQYGTEMQLGNFPTTIVKDYSISILDQITKNVEVDRNQSDLIEKNNARLQTIENILANLKLAEGESF